MSSFFDLNNATLRAKRGGRRGEERTRRKLGRIPRRRGHSGWATRWVGGWVGGRNQTLHATLCGQFFPKPSGGEIVRTTLYISL